MNPFLIAVIVAAGLWLLLLLVLLLLGKRTAARELFALLPNLVALFRGIARDPRTPRREKWLLAATALWLASPIDLIPEFIPILGPLDDAVVAALVLRRVVRVIGSQVIEDHWRGNPATLQRAFRVLRVPSAKAARPERD